MSDVSKGGKEPGIEQHPAQPDEPASKPEIIIIDHHNHDEEPEAGFFSNYLAEVIVTGILVPIFVAWVISRISRKNRNSKKKIKTDYQDR